MPTPSVGTGARSLGVSGVFLATTLLLAACEAPGRAPWTGDLEALAGEMEDRFTPGLHSLMTELQHRHASLWFAGEAENWLLADYFLHELEELTEKIEALHPVYDEIPVAQLLRGHTLPPIEGLEAAVKAGDPIAFERGYDQLTQGCNSCHVASDRGFMVITRPTVPPLTNLQYRP
jgi:hypothetical protein